MKRILNGIDLKVLLSFAAVYIIWGTTYLFIKIGLESFPPFLMASFRYVIAGSVLMLACLIKKERIISPTILRSMILGAFMLTMGQGILFWAQQYLPSGLTAIYIATLPLCYILTDYRNWKSYFASKLTLVSLAMGLVGIYILFRDQIGNAPAESSHMQVIATIVVIISCLCWAMGSLYYKYHKTGNTLFSDVAWQLIGGGICCSIVGLATSEWSGFRVAEVSGTGWLAVSYLAIAGSVIAFTASYYLLSKRPAAIVGTYAYVNPVIAVLLGWLVAEESISVSQVIGMAIILVAAYMSNRVKFGVSE